MVVEALFGDALAPAVAFDLFYVVFVLLAVCKVLVALHLPLVGFELLVVIVLLNSLVLLKALALLQLKLLMDPAARVLV